MATCAPELQDLLLDIGGMSAAELEQRGRAVYGELYLDAGGYGVRRTHDCQLLMFHARQFDHAFFTSSDRWSHPERKDKLRPGSIERIRWIAPIVGGAIEESACFEVPGPTGRRRPPNRLYASFRHPFVIWLEPRKDEGWKFASAYPCSIEEIHKYMRGGRTVWRWRPGC